MSIFMDIVVLLVIAVFVINGYRRGVINILVHFCGAAVSAIAAALVGSFLAQQLYYSFMQKRIIEFFENCMPPERLAQTAGDIASEMVDNCPEYFQNIMSIMNITKTDIAMAIGSASIEVPALVEGMIRPAVLRLVTVILAIAVYTVCAAIISLATKSLTTAADITGLKPADRIGGAVLGILAAVVIIMFLSFVLYLLVVFLPEESSRALRIGIDNSFLYKYIYQFNVPDQIVSIIVNSQ